MLEVRLCTLQEHRRALSSSSRPPPPTLICEALPPQPSGVIDGVVDALAHGDGAQNTPHLWGVDLPSQSAPVAFSEQRGEKGHPHGAPC